MVKGTIREAVAEIIKLGGKDIFKDSKRFLAFLDDLAPDYAKERRIIKNNFDDSILKLFVDETKSPSQRLGWVKMKLEDLEVSKNAIDFIIESFGLAFGWEDEVRNLKVNSPISHSSLMGESRKQFANADVKDISLNDDVLKQWGFYDKNALPSVFNILSTYETPFGIPYRVTKIDSEIFKDCDKLQTVVIPDTITEIGDSAFENCRSLEKIYIPDSVTKIGNRAFANCKSLNNITIPNSVIEIGNSAFGGCSSLVTAVISDKITKISEGLFGKCRSLVNIAIPNGVTEIGDMAFAGCESLPNILIPKSVTKIGKRVFANCKSLDSMIIPVTVADIGLETFGGCAKLQLFTLPTKYTIFKDDVNRQIDLTSKVKMQNIQPKVQISSQSSQQQQQAKQQAQQPVQKQGNPFKSAKVGDYVKFGSYPQTSNSQNQSIEWKVLSIENNKMLVISRYGLDAKRFDGSSNVWKNSEIRKWLNGEFYNKAFIDQEKKCINLSNLLDVGTSDNVFLLSKKEAEKYFFNNDARRCKATDYAVKNGALVDNGYSCWWLRSPNLRSGNLVYCVINDGVILDYATVSISNFLVRPALSINL